MNLRMYAQGEYQGYSYVFNESFVLVSLGGAEVFQLDFPVTGTSKHHKRHTIEAIIDILAAAFEGVTEVDVEADLDDSPSPFIEDDFEIVEFEDYQGV